MSRIVRYVENRERVHSDSQRGEGLYSRVLWATRLFFHW